MKSLEHIIVGRLRDDVNSVLDPYQFAYKNNRNTSDALNTVSHLILKHLENRMSYVRLLFIDFSSAFNTMLPQVLLGKLKQMEVNPYIIKWYHSFLVDRQQQVKVNLTLSELQTVSVGAPQACTNDCRNQNENNYIIKFSDDTVILSLLEQGSDVSLYKAETEKFVEWCDTHNLLLNVKKTKEMVLDPKSVGECEPISIKGEIIEQVPQYNYLGVIFDQSLCWMGHVEYVCSRICQRLHFLRRLRLYGVHKGVMMVFYKAIIESILRYGITVWFGNLTVKLKSQINHLTGRARKIIGQLPLSPLQEIYEESVLKQARKIVSDPNHVLHEEYELLPSGRRYRLPKCGSNKYKFSFVPSSTKLLNKN
ncbi:hypothetical protein LDENG_00108420 [Lucifuga dentata]|nr:hypothetical protein LDENG_00108420 [Lucifuga dentata]